MASAIVDTNILIELYRNNPNAIRWYTAQRDLAVTAITWFEIMAGSRGKSGQQRDLQILAQFNLEFHTDTDQRWAMAQLLSYRLRHGVSFTDCLIVSVAHRLQVPIYTQNVKDFVAILPASQIVKSY